MLKVQVSIPELKAHAEAIRAMAMDPMKTLQTLAGDLRGRFQDWTNEVMQAELSLHLDREPYERTAQSPKNHRDGYRSRRIRVKGLGTLELRVPRTGRESSRVRWSRSGSSTTRASSRISGCCFWAVLPRGRWS
jgi:hypothetical protein